MVEDILPILTRFHHEVIAPEMKRVEQGVVGGLEGRMNAHFGAIYERFDRLETVPLPSRVARGGWTT